MSSKALPPAIEVEWESLRDNAAQAKERLGTVLGELAKIEVVGLRSSAAMERRNRTSR